MGFFDLFRKKQVEKAEQETVKTNELENWLSDQSKETFSELDKSIKEISKRLNAEKEQIKNNLNALEQAELKNEVPERAKQMMEGNRQAYLQKVNSFLKKVELPNETSQLNSFIEIFESELHSFESNIGKAHTVMEEFFHEKAGVIAAGIKRLDKIIKDLENVLKKSKASSIESINLKLNHLNDSIKEKEKTQNEIIETENKIKEQLSILRKTKSSLEELRSSSDFVNETKKINQKEELENELRKLESTINHYFSEVDSALKKYENLSENKLAKSYVNDSLTSLLSDDNLEIIKIINATLSAIESDEIQLKDKKKDKTIIALQNLTEEKLKTFQQEHLTLTDELSKTISQIETSNILNKEHELNDQIDSQNNELNSLEESLSSLKEHFNKTKIEELTKIIEEDINATFNTNIKII